GGSAMKALNAGQALATVLVDEFVRNGLAHACIAPGSRSTPMALAFVGHPGVAIHVLIDERSAAFCALGIARASGSPAAVLCTSGTAAANFHPAVIEADRGRIPLLVLTADRPPELRGTGANQTIDQIKLYGDAVRWFAEVGVPEALPGSVGYWRSAACRAWAASVGSPPGPVHLNLAFRDPLVPVADDAGFPHPLDGRAGQEPWTRTGASLAGMSAGDRRGLRDQLGAAQRCLVVAGEAPGGAGVGHAPAALAASGGWPLLADPLSGARMGATAISAYEAILRHPGFAGAMRPDLVVRVGSMGTSKPLASYLGPEIPQVVVDPDGDWADPGRSAQWIIRAEPSELPSLVEPSGPRPWTQYWLEAEVAARGAIDAVLDAEDSPSEPRTARDLAAWCPDGATLVAASSMPIRD